MKSTTYIVEITNQKNEKYLSEGRNPLACLSPRLLASCRLRNFRVSLLKSVLPYLAYQAARFISRGISRSYFSGNFLPSFLLWHGFKILAK